MLSFLAFLIDINTVNQYEYKERQSKPDVL